MLNTYCKKIFLQPDSTGTETRRTADEKKPGGFCLPGFDFWFNCLEGYLPARTFRQVNRWISQLHTRSSNSDRY